MKNMKRCLVTVLAAVLALSPSTGVFASEKVFGRILSLDLCSDWMLARYAERSRVLALSNFIRQYPVAWVGSDWPTHDGSLERILALQPDLVITGEYNAPILRARLQELGLRVQIMPLPQSLPEVVAYERRFLTLLQLPLQRAAQPAAAIPKRGKAPRLLLLGANGIGTGRQTFEHDILLRAGW